MHQDTSSAGLPSSREWEFNGLRHTALIVLAVVLVLAGMTAPSPAGAATDPAPAETIQPELSARFVTGGSTDFWVEFKAQAGLNPAAKVQGWSARGAAVVTALRSTAESSQAGVLGLLRDAGVRHTSLYINNSIYVYDGSPDLAERLAADPGVERIRVPRTYTLPKPSPGERVASADPVEWGLSAIHADKVWSEYGTTGRGIVIGNIDSGVDFDHPALVASYRGNDGDGTFTHDYNWFDPTGVCGTSPSAPCDNFGHGTHTMGTMVGDGGPGNQIGVAPGARWIAAKGCQRDQCGELALALSAQWMLAPTAPDGSGPDPSKRPNILNNSWSSAPGDPWYQDYVRQWVAAGIFPAFAVGNDGPKCGTQHAPGEYPESYAVGAVDKNGAVAWFSSRGTAESAGSKPDIVAPGQGVRSSVPGGGYQVQNGTSMATPHVSGAVALLWSAAPALVGDIAATRAILDRTAHDHADTTCGGTAEDNNVYGEGMLDVHRAVGASPRAGTGELTGAVTDASTGKPMEGVRVTATGPRGLETTTAGDGTYHLYLDEGGYALGVSFFGYDTRTVEAVHVTGEKTTTRDVALSPAARATATVRVADGSGHGWPIYAALTVEGTSRTWFTAPGDGRAALDLPVGGTYQVTVTPRYPGYRPVTGQITVESDMSANFAAEIDATSCSAPGYAAEGGNCRPVPGGLVYGAVTDANTGKPVNTATVTSGGGENDTAATPDDPALPDGFYRVFSPMSEKRVLTAAQRGYRSVTALVRAGADKVSRIDFSLTAGLLALKSGDMSEKTPLGTEVKRQLTITNRGTAPLTYDFAESARDSAIRRADGIGLSASATRSQGAPPRRVEVTGISPGPVTRPAAGEETGPRSGAAAAPWTTIADYPTTIRDNAAGYHDGRVYSFGGSLRGEAATPASYVYDPIATSWTRLADMPDARQKPASAFVDGRFYVVAGWGSQGTPAATTLVYDPETDGWSTGADNPHPWGAVGSAVLDGKIYSVGGCAGECQSATDQVTVYDVASDSFTAAAPYPEPVSWPSCGGVDGKVVCAGGLAAGPHGTQHAYAYDPGRNSWTRAADLPLDLWASSYAVANGTLVVAGGVAKAGSTVTNETFAYDADTDTWTALPNSGYALWRGAAACGFYKIGGGDGPRVLPFNEMLPGYGGCDPAGTGVPWLSVHPQRGTLAPGRSVKITLTLDARQVTQPGTYEAMLTVREDTPYKAPSVGVTLKAEAPWSWARLSGQVLSEACDGKATPLAGATVTIRRGRDSWTLGTDADGRYAGWIQGGLLRAEVTVTADGHRSSTFTVRPLPHSDVRRDVTLPRRDC
ncbi:S8 family serine peptidase [Streptosporangium sp. NBC_01756]|uniref:S8 family serine peptidase n=1 Tax=Streptosporangium sp. NBC_01756 TaxID=2975950 RepID=UPI002DDC6351|nr:S8 family serine peptidase [Streptosporangium sp. NBC_01756]WSC84366.1 S8 family serine peptidase [Streptosporangium sp. NBC_01756]